MAIYQHVMDINEQVERNVNRTETESEEIWLEDRLEDKIKFRGQ